MVRKQVYGKRAKTVIAFGTSDTFSSAVPDADPAGDDVLTDITTQVNNLKITETIPVIVKDTPEKVVLKEKDANRAHPIVVINKSRSTRKVRAPATCNPETSESKATGRSTRDPPKVIICDEVKPVDIPEPDAISSHDNDPLTSYVQPLLDLCSDPLGRQAPTKFSEWSDRLETYFKVSKIAEASYGEVYRLSLNSTKTGLTKADESILKFIAIKPPEANTESRGSKGKKIESKDTSWMSSVDGVQSEVRLLRRMVPVPGFTNFREIRILKGRPTKPFITAWKAFMKSQPKDYESGFPDPSKRSSFSEDQLWAVIEMQDAGIDLERVQLQDIWSVWDVFWGTALAIGKGETGMRYEHRDLHLGNICIRMSRPDEDIASRSIRNISSKFGYTGLETTIIDYTLSRADMNDPVEDADSNTNLAAEDVAYLDCEQDQTLFQGDATEEYQYEIYRYMRGAIFYKDPTAKVPKKIPQKIKSHRSWKDYNPLTNLIWLHFVLHTLLEQIKWPSQDDGHREREDEGNELEEITLARLHSGERKDLARKRAAQLERRLRRLDKMISIKNLVGSGFTCAVDLIGYAIAEGWLKPEDVNT